MPADRTEPMPDAEAAPLVRGCGDPEHPDGAYCTNTTGLPTCYPPAATPRASSAADRALRETLTGLAREWEADASRRSGNHERRDDPTNLLAAGINRSHAESLRAALRHPPTSETRETLRAELERKSWVEDAHGEVVLLSDATDALDTIADQPTSETPREATLATIADDIVELRRQRDEARFHRVEALAAADFLDNAGWHIERNAAGVVTVSVDPPPDPRGSGS